MDGVCDTVEVDVNQLSGYSKILADKQSHAAEIKGLVGQSDVTNESWGVVGCFLKPQYEQMLAELLGLLDNMKEGLNSASEKFADTAEAYRVSDQNGERVFKQLLEKVTPHG